MNTSKFNLLTKLLRSFCRRKGREADKMTLTTEVASYIANQVISECRPNVYGNNVINASSYMYMYIGGIFDVD